MSGVLGRIPIATYRLQLHRGFTMRDAVAVVPYLRDLGVSDLYLSPILEARPGSLHGYDVVNPQALNPELGGDEGFAELSAAVRQAGLGLILDIVPNHMCISDPRNTWWQDVLENGPSSPFSRTFDIDWRPPKEDLHDRVLLPILADQYGRELESGRISIVEEDGAFRLVVNGVRLPLAPRSWRSVLQEALEHLRKTRDEQDASRLELESILTALEHLPRREETDPERVRLRLRERNAIRIRLARLLIEDRGVRTAVDCAVASHNGVQGQPRSFDRLAALLVDQGYRLSYWRVAADEINYRRFFDINELAAIRVEDPQVFSAVHTVSLGLVATGAITGFRVDHPDGLYDPEQYFRDLQAAIRGAIPRGEEAPPETRMYVVGEKILCGEERFPPSWQAHGTTGYEFLNSLNAIHVDSTHAASLVRAYERFTGVADRPEDLIYQSKKLVLRASMSSELFVLARRLDRISEQHRYSMDFTFNTLQEALTEYIACFPAYRTYLRPGEAVVDDQDRRNIAVAIHAARRRNPTTSADVFDFLRSVLVQEHPEGLTEAQLEERRDFVMRLQQLTGPVMAKGLEDTAFYRRFPLASLNEVGGEPAEFGISIETFHRRMEARMRQTPHGMSATSTHDTKRGEDVRARLNVLSEIAPDWDRCVRRWADANAPWRGAVEGQPAPDRNDEYLLYQTLVGAWPLEDGTSVSAQFADRIEAYMVKAVREAKRHTSWINVEVDYERAVSGFVRALLLRDMTVAFRTDLVRFTAQVNEHAWPSMLAQVLIKTTAPGVPDFYQGSETTYLQLVDPDNRGPVEFERLRRRLGDLMARSASDREALLAQLLRSPSDGRLKMYVVREALQARRRRESLYRNGAYLPLKVRGQRREHIVAFARTAGSEACLTVTGRLLARLGVRYNDIGAWGDTSVTLPRPFAGSRWRDALTGREFSVSTEGIPASDLFAVLPLALLERIA